MSAPVSCCLSAAGVGLLDRPVPARDLGLPSRSAYQRSLDPYGDSAFRTRELRPGRVPPLPRDRWCPHGWQERYSRHRRFPAASPTPRHHIPSPGPSV